MSMMGTFTREELVQLYPEGTVSVQVDDDVRAMTTAEWALWIDAQVGMPKLDEQA